MLCRRCNHVFHRSSLPRSLLSARNSNSVSAPRPQFKREWKLHPMFSIPVVCFSLGFWQIERRKAKLKFLEDVNARYNLEAVPLDCSFEYDEYTPVLVTGEYDYSHEFYLGPRHELVDYRDKGQPGGYHSIVPMTLDTGERILVDRGWVSSRSKRPVGQLPGQVQQKGYIRYPEPPVMAILAPPPGSSNTYIWRDSDMMGRIAESLPITVELMAEHTTKDGPIAGQTRLSVYNKHMEYIITWFGLGIASLFFIIRYKRKPKNIPKVFK